MKKLLKFKNNNYFNKIKLIKMIIKILKKKLKFKKKYQKNNLIIIKIIKKIN